MGDILPSAETLTACSTVLLLPPYLVSPRRMLSCLSFASSAKPLPIEASAVNTVMWPTSDFLPWVQRSKTPTWIGRQLPAR